jgi:hypothetical protein
MGILLERVYDSATTAYAKAFITYIRVTVPATSVLAVDVLGTSIFRDIWCQVQVLLASFPTPPLSSPFPTSSSPQDSRCGEWTVLWNDARFKTHPGKYPRPLIEWFCHLYCFHIKPYILTFPSLKRQRQRQHNLLPFIIKQRRFQLTGWTAFVMTLYLEPSWQDVRRYC